MRMPMSKIDVLHVVILLGGAWTHHHVRVEQTERIWVRIKHEVPLIPHDVAIVLR